MRPRTRFGQHFLEPAWVARLIAAIDPGPADRFLEIGPGRGALTLPLAKRAGRVLAVEIDRDLAAALGTRLPPNARLVTANVLDVDLGALARTLSGDGGDEAEGGRLRVAGNLPYNVAVPILFRLLTVRQAVPALADATVMLQQEVAERLLARPGTRDYGVLSIFVRIHADATRLLTLPPGAFRPAPRVTSAVVRLTFRPPLVSPADPAGFERLVRAVFTQRRKIMLNALKPFAEASGRSAGEALAKVGVDARRRPETLEVAELAALADFLTSG
jgi:16S rRNA (adenine1518-N6/adenine1519-N6)-dimethyltransferase